VHNIVLTAKQLAALRFMVEKSAYGQPFPDAQTTVQAARIRNPETYADILRRLLKSGLIEESKLASGGYVVTEAGKKLAVAG